MSRPLPRFPLAAIFVVIAIAAQAASVTTYVSAKTTLTPGTPGGSIAALLGTLDFTADALTVTASGTAYYGAPSSYGGPTNSTTPDGLATLYNGLPFGSLIGIFSSSASAISAIGSAFEIGSNRTFLAPTGGPAYLFLGYNDSYYWDNSGGFSVVVSYTPAPTQPPQAGPSPVPLPTGGLLLATALGLGAGLWRRAARKR
ncbi:MAG: hypothetical protein KGI94_04485 [Paracoccaceae bacterium]|nr:hypothetical protein [Paracoccaceae bacterium]